MSEAEEDFPTFVETGESRGKYDQVTWTPVLERRLVDNVFLERAHLKEAKSSERVNEKWDVVVSNTLPGKNVNKLTIRQHFRRLYQKFVSKYALEKEGANLSGLEEEMSHTESTLFEIWKELTKRESDDRQRTAAQSLREHAMLCHEQKISIMAGGKVGGAAQALSPLI